MQLRKKQDLNPFIVFLAPPSFEELEKRLRGRKTETEDQIQRRLKTAKNEMDALHNDKDHTLFDHVLVNDQIDATYEQFKQVLRTKMQLNF